MSEEKPPKPQPLNYALKPGFHTPQRTGAIGMYLFLASLFMLFAAGLFGYVIIRIHTVSKFAPGSLHLPEGLWISTVLVVIGSFTIQRAVHEVRREHQQAFRHWLGATLIIAIVFVIVQAPSMVLLLQRQHVMAGQKIALYGLIFVLVLLHAAHVLGGIIALLRTGQQASRGVYDHEHFQPVRHVALYWHFLDAVWLAMFFTFLLMG